MNYPIYKNSTQLNSQLSAIHLQTDNSVSLTSGLYGKISFTAFAENLIQIIKNKEE